MPRIGTAAALKSLVSKLQDQRNEHAAAIAEIDATFEGLGIGGGAAPAKTKRGRPAGSGKAKVTKVVKHRKRRKFAQTAEQLILGLLTGGKKLATAEVNAAWRKAGRSGKADITLGKLVKAKKVIRTKIKGERGSQHAAS